MSIVFAALTPHCPLLHDSIGMDAKNILPETVKAFDILKKELYVQKIDTLFFITPHGSSHTRAFEVLGNPMLVLNLSDFGDLITKDSLHTDTGIVSHIYEAGQKMHIPYVLDSAQECDNGVSIPWLMLRDVLVKVKIVVIRSCQLSPKQHVDCGYLLKGVAQQSNKRIGIIATGDLSHALTSDSPAGFSKHAKNFDNEIIECVGSLNTTRLLHLDTQVIKEAHACIYEPLLILCGIIGRMRTTPKILSHEECGGVGYLSTFFDFQS